MPWTLFRQQMKELTWIALLALSGMTALFVFVLLMQLSIQLGGVGAGILLTFIPSLGLGYQTYLIPVSILAASALVFSRMSADGELTALRACGVPAWKYLVPALLLGLIASLPAAFVAFSVNPKAYAERDRLKVEALAGVLTSLDPGPHELVFDTFAITYRDYKDNAFEGLTIRMIEDGKVNGILTSSRASLHWDPATESLYLSGGENTQYLQFDESGTLRKSQTRASLEMAELQQSLYTKKGMISPKAAPTSELLSRMRELHSKGDPEAKYLNAELVRRSCFAIAPLLLALFGAAVGGLLVTRNAIIPVSVALISGSAGFFGLMKVADVIAREDLFGRTGVACLEVSVVLIPFVVVSAILVRKIQRA